MLRQPISFHLLPIYQLKKAKQLKVGRSESGVKINTKNKLNICFVFPFLSTQFAFKTKTEVDMKHHKSHNMNWVYLKSMIYNILFYCSYTNTPINGVGGKHKNSCEYFQVFYYENIICLAFLQHNAPNHLNMHMHMNAHFYRYINH